MAEHAFEVQGFLSARSGFPLCEMKIFSPLLSTLCLQMGSLGLRGALWRSPAAFAPAAFYCQFFDLYSQPLAVQYLQVAHAHRHFEWVFRASEDLVEPRHGYLEDLGGARRRNAGAAFERPGRPGETISITQDGLRHPGWSTSGQFSQSPPLPPH